MAWPGCWRPRPLCYTCTSFYHVYHPDYVAYLRGTRYSWGFGIFSSFLNYSVAPQLGTSGSTARSQILMDLVPYQVGGVDAPLFMAVAFGVVALLLLIRGRAGGLAAVLAGVVFTFITFGYQRVQTATGGNTASFPWARMYLALPVLWVWLLLLANQTPWRRFAYWRVTRWVVRGSAGGIAGGRMACVRTKKGPTPRRPDHRDSHGHGLPARGR